MMTRLGLPCQTPDFGGGSSWCSCSCDRGKSKSTPSPRPKTWSSTICDMYLSVLQGLSGGGSVGGSYAVTPNTSLYGAVSGYKAPGQSVKVRSSFKY